MQFFKVFNLIDDVHLPSSSTYDNVDMNETSELNNSSIQAQQSTCLQTTTKIVPGEVGVSSTNYGDGIFNAETVTTHARDAISLGISGGSIGMCASHEADKLIKDITIFFHFKLAMVLKLELLEKLYQTWSSVEKQPYPAMYSSVFGGIILDPAMMVIPIDDNMLHRGHGVFDTAIILQGYLYELDAHLDRFSRSASKAKILRTVLEGDANRRALASIKTLVYHPSVRNKKAIFTLICQTLKHLPIINNVLQAASILNTKWKLQQELVYIIVYDILFGQGVPLVGDARKNVTTIEELFALQEDLHYKQWDPGVILEP